MKNTLSLLLAGTVILGISSAASAATIGSTASYKESPRDKAVESVLRGSGVCKHYPVVVRIGSNNEALVATYGDRTLSDRDRKLVAAKIAHTVLSGPNAKIANFHIRIYDPASRKFFSDIYLSAADAKSALSSGSTQEKALAAIKLLKNRGLSEGTDLESRVALYQRILRLQRQGVTIGNLLTTFEQIESKKRSNQDVTADISNLEAEVAAKESANSKTASSTDAATGKSSLSALQQAYQEASDNEAAARKDLEDKQAEWEGYLMPEGFYWGQQIDKENELEQMVHDAAAAWSKANDQKDLALEALQTSK